MGVKGLWKLLEPTGKAVSLESLSGKILAIDVSMWLHQLSKGMRDSKGQPIKNAHLMGLFKRICKLLFYGIKPIFVFDGSVPALKRQTIALRQKRRSEANSNSKQSLKKMLNKMLQRYAVSNIAGSHGNLKVNKQGQVSKKQNDDDDIFKLPTTEYPLMMNPNNENNDDDCNHDGKPQDSRMQSTVNSIEDAILSSQDYDFDSEDFTNLPNSVKLELLTEYKEKHKKTSWENISLLPKDADEFSGYQIRRLMNFNKITKQIDSVRQDSNKGISNDEYGENSILGVSHIASRDDVRFVYAKRKNPQEIAAGGKKSQKDEDSFKALLKKYNSNSFNNNVSNITRNFVPFVLESSPTKECYVSQVENKMNDKFLLPINSMKNISSSSTFSYKGENEKFKSSINKVKFKNDDDEDSGNEEDFPDASQENNENKKAPDETRKPEESNYQELYDSIISHKNSVPHSSVLFVTPPGSTISITPATTSTSSTTTQPTLNLLQSSITELTPTSVISSLENAESQEEILINKIENDQNMSTEKLLTNIENNNEIISTESVNDKVVVEIERPNNEAQSSVDEAMTEIIEDEDEDDDEMTENVREMINDVLEKAQIDNNDNLNITDIEDKLSSELTKLREERGKQERLACNITDQMNSEAQDLLRLFGIPYVISPAEAEAQCAYLDRTGQTDGTISDDSDSFLFGAKCVVKNLFSGDDVAELYKSEDIEKRLLLNQFHLICVGMLCGSDYTDGVRGVGPITAMEILHEFKGEGLECLIKFKEWWCHAVKQKKPPSKETKVKTKLRQLHLSDGFPCKAVFEAYTGATVDESMEPFHWGKPQFDALERYASKTLGWSNQQVDDMMVPLMKKLQNNDLFKQKELTDYFATKSKTEAKNIKSKRLRQVINLRLSQKDPSVNKKYEKSTGKKVNEVIVKAPNIIIPKELNLSEESDFDDDGVSDSALASIDIDGIVASPKAVESKKKTKKKKKS